MSEFLTPRRRAWAYGVAGAGLAVGGVYGYLDGQQIAAWMGLAAALFGVALANTPTNDPGGSEPRQARED